MNLLKIAEENTNYLKNEYFLLRNKYSHEKKIQILDDFIDLVKNKWNLSINLRMHDLNLFFTEGEYKNKYDLEKEGKDYGRLLKYLKNRKKRNIKGKQINNKRDIFDNSFENGRKNQYLSLNIGGLGIKKYGNFCLIIKQNQVKNYKSLIFIKEDSLNYINGSNVNIEKLKKEVSNKNFVHLLTVIKHKDDIFSPGFIEKCHNIICCDNNYIEAITQDKIIIGHIDCVRISRTDYNSYFKVYNTENNKNNFEAQRFRSYIFLGIIKTLEKHNIKLEKVDENGN